MISPGCLRQGKHRHEIMEAERPKEGCHFGRDGGAPIVLAGWEAWCGKWESPMLRYLDEQNGKGISRMSHDGHPGQGKDWGNSMSCAGLGTMLGPKFRRGDWARTLPGSRTVTPSR